MIFICSFAIIINYKQLIFLCAIQFLFEIFLLFSETKWNIQNDQIILLTLYIYVTQIGKLFMKNAGWYKQCLILSYNTGTCNGQSRLKKEKKWEKKLHIVTKSDKIKISLFCQKFSSQKKKLAICFMWIKRGMHRFVCESREAKN